MRAVAFATTNIFMMSPTVSQVPVRRILVVEDHADTRKYLQLYLESKGYAVTTAKTKTEARQLFEREPAQILISDVGLPDGTGWDLLKEIRKARPIYAIAISGFGGRADKLTSESVGFDHHITKPFDPDDLDRALAQAPS